MIQYKLGLTISRNYSPGSAVAALATAGGEKINKRLNAIISFISFCSPGPELAHLPHTQSHDVLWDLSIILNGGHL